MIESIIDNWFLSLIWTACLGVAGLLHGENQTILLHEIGAFEGNKTWFPNSHWWNTVPIMPKNKVLLWLVRYPFAWARDGYHFTSGMAWFFTQIVPVVFLLDVVFYWEWHWILIQQLSTIAWFGVMANISLEDLI